MVVSGLVGTTRLQEDGGNVVGGERLTVHDLNVHAAAVEDPQDILLLDGDASLLHDGDGLTNPGEGNELVALRDSGATVINTLDKEGTEGDLVVIKSGNQTGETVLTGGLDLKDLAGGIKVEEAPESTIVTGGNLVPGRTEGIIVSVDVHGHCVFVEIEFLE